MNATVYFFRAALFSALTGFASSGRTQAPEWSAHIQGLYGENAVGSCEDPNGNIYVTGNISEGMIAGTPVDVTSIYDIYLAKFNAAGALQWVVTPGGGSQMDFNEGDLGYDVLYDSTSDAAYLCGIYQGFNSPAIFGPGIEVSGSGAFIAKYDPSGTCLWMRAANRGRGASMGLDGTGAVYLYCWSDDSFPNMSFYGPPYTTVPWGPCIAKYSGDGDLLWARSIGYYMDGQIHVRNNRIYFSGVAYGTSPALLGVSITNNSVSGVAVVAALDTSATNILWHKVYPSPVLSNFGDMSFSSDSIFLVLGAFKDSLYLPSDTLVGIETEYRPVFIRMDSAGTIQSVATFDMSISYAAISSAPDGTFYSALRFAGTFDMLGDIYTSSGPWDIALVHCTEDGEPIGLLHVGPGDLGSIDVLSTSDNGVLLSGRFDNTVDLGGGQTLSGTDDAFVAKYGLITGIETPRASTSDQLHIYANPNDGTCTVDLPSSLQWTDDLVLNIHDTEGRLVQSIPVGRGSSNMALDIRAQAKGSYFLELTDGQQRYSGTIVFE